MIINASGCSVCSLAAAELMTSQAAAASGGGGGSGGRAGGGSELTARGYVVMLEGVKRLSLNKATSTTITTDVQYK